MKKEKVERVLCDGQNFVYSLMAQSESLDERPKYIYDSKNQIESISPAEHLFGYTYHSHTIPPFKPESTLILGYGMGTCSELMRKVWGQMKVCGVDSRKGNWPYIEDKVVVGDAYDFVKECSNAFIKRRYDYVLIDLFENGEVPNFVFTSEFAVMLRMITKSLICVNVKMNDFERLTRWMDYGLKFHRHSQVFGNNISFWGL